MPQLCLGAIFSHLPEEMTEYCTSANHILQGKTQKFIPILYGFKSPEMAISMEAEVEAKVVRFHITDSKEEVEKPMTPSERIECQSDEITDEEDKRSSLELHDETLLKNMTMQEVASEEITAEKADQEGTDSQDEYPSQFPEEGENGYHIISQDQQSP